MLNSRVYLLGVDWTVVDCLMLFADWTLWAVACYGVTVVGNGVKMAPDTAKYENCKKSKKLTF